MVNPIVLNCHYDEIFDIDILVPELIKIAKQTLKKCGVSLGAASIYITSDEYIKRLNEKYRGIDEVTDVLSFSNDHEGEYYGSEDDNRVGLASEKFVIPEDVTDQIGEVVISLPQAERQALEHKVDPAEELKFLVVHGFLHLLGYDHMKLDDKREMESLEKEIMAR